MFTQVNVLEHSTTSHEVRNNQDKPVLEHVVEATVEVTFINADDPEDRCSFKAVGHGIDRSDKAPGKATTYAVKTVYLNAFHLKGQPDNEADDRRGASDHSKADRSAGSPSAGAARPRPVNDTAAASADYVVRFTAHKGKKISDPSIPDDYLEWMVRDAKYADAREAAAAELKRRESQKAPTTNNSNPS